MIRLILRTFVLIASLGFTTLPALAQPYDVVVGDLTLSGAFTRAMPPNARTGGGFLSITNTGTMDDRLISVSSPMAPRVEMHQMTMEDDVMIMRPRADGIAIPAGETVELAPGGLHLMFIQVPQAFVEGGQVPITMEFEIAGSIDVILPVAPLGATAMSR